MTLFSHKIMELFKNKKNSINLLSAMTFCKIDYDNCSEFYTDLMLLLTSNKLQAVSPLNIKHLPTDLLLIKSTKNTQPREFILLQEWFPKTTTP
jgi:hypothetical protein